MKKNIEISKKYPLYIENYTKKFGKFVAVRNVSFSVTRGKIHGFIGPNGAGKTTTIKAIIGAYSKSFGKIIVEGYKAGTPKAKSKIGYIPERASFPATMTCMEYLVTMAELSGFKPKLAREKAASILKELGMEKHKNRKPIAFSSGMKKKILVAQALMLDPHLLVLDEPAASLDPTARKEMFQMFKDIKKKGCSILLSSHILTELQDIVDEVTFISQGEIRFSGTVNDLSKESGIFISFLGDIYTENNPVKKYGLEETTSGWVKKTKTHSEAKILAKKIISDKTEINQIGFLKSNLSYAYDKLVLEHGRESGINDPKVKTSFFSKLFNKKPKTDLNYKIKNGGKK